MGSSSKPAQTAAHRKHERGYIVSTTAILLVPLMVFVALATDVGGWTVQAVRAQNAADAAALAGAPYLPDEDKAEAAAIEVAANNGYIDGVDGVVVEVSFPTPQTTRVTITDQSDIYFSGVVVDETFDITRWADATTRAPVHMGSPTNVFGFGPYSIDGSTVAGYWVLENNQCQVAHYGDLRAAKYDASPYCGSYGPDTRTVWKGASEGRDGGYFFVVEIPPGLDETSTLMVFDPGKCKGYGSKPNDGGWNHATNGTDVDFRMWSTNGTALLPGDDTPVTGLSGTDAQGWWTDESCAADSLPTNTSAWTDKTQGWTESPFVFPANTTGETERWLIQTRALGDTAQGWNHYAFWVKPETGTSCSTISAATCPTIGAEDWVSLNAAGPGPGQPMQLFLGEVLPEHAGKAMQVMIWDPGEGMDNIQVLDPNGDSLDFTWTSDDPTQGSNNSSDTCSGDPCLALHPNNTSYAPKLSLPGWGNHYRFNGRLITLTVPLDSQIDWTSYGHFWFRLEFNPLSDKTAKEWASFSFTVTGDPIRLVD